MAKTSKPHLHLARDATADQFLASDPLALLIGLVLDQQVPMERAFSAPLDLEGRLGHPLDVNDLAAADPDELAEVFARRPALHRFPSAMAKRVQALAEHLIEHYDGDARRVWSDAPDGATLLRRLKALPGFGDGKARITLALLGKQYGVTPPGWREAAGAVGAPGVFLSIADIVDDTSYAKVRAAKKEAKAKAKAKSS